MTASAANGVESGDTVSLHGVLGGNKMGFSEGSGRAPGGRYMLASARLGARPREHQEMCGETSGPSHCWLKNSTERRPVGTVHTCWEAGTAAGPERTPQAPVSHDSEYRSQPKEGGGCLPKNAFHLDFPGGPVVENQPASVGDMDSIPSLGRLHMHGVNKAHGSQPLRLAHSRACTLQQEEPRQ